MAPSLPSEVQMRRFLLTAVAAAALFAGACTDQTPVPTAPRAILDPNFDHVTPTGSQIRDDQIKPLFREDLMQPLTSKNQEQYALDQFSKVEQKMNAYNAATSEDERKLRLKEARVLAFALMINAYIRFQKGDLVGGKSKETLVDMVVLDASVARFVHIPNVPEVSAVAAAETEDVAVGFITSLGGRVAPQSNEWDLVADPSSVSTGVSVLVIGTRIDEASIEGGSFGQILPPAIRWTATFSDGSTSFLKDVRLRACFVTTGQSHPAASNPGFPAPQDTDNDPTTQRVVLARLLANGAIEVPPAIPEGDPALTSPLLDCTAVTASAPRATRADGSGMLALARAGLEAAFEGIAWLLTPKPAYAFTLVAGCKTKLLSDWFILDQYSPVQTVTVTPPSSTIKVGETVTLTATLAGPNGFTLQPGTVTPQRAVTWSATSSNGGAVTLSPSSSGGSVTVTGTAIGTVTVTATSEGIVGTATVKVDPLGTIVIYGGSSAASNFKTKAESFGYLVTTLPASDWAGTAAAKTTAYFQGFDIVAVPTIEAGADVAPLAAGKNISWGPAINGSIVITGLHADAATHNADAGAPIFLKNALRWLAMAPGTSFISFIDCPSGDRTPYDWAPSASPFTGLSAVSCTNTDDITILDENHPVMKGGPTSADDLTNANALLDNWGQSLHTYFPSIGSFTVIATGTGGGISVTTPTGGISTTSNAVLVWTP
jgi:hypothetical protein